MRTRTSRPRPHVTPEAVVKTALGILDTEGIERVTFRAIAQKLGVQAPALYWHFINKRDLMDDLAQAILVGGGLDAVTRPAAPAEWREWLAQLARTLRQALIAHRDGGRVVAGASFFRAHALVRLLMTSTEVLSDAGFGLLEAGLSTGTVVDYVWGFVIEEQEGPHPPLEARISATREQRRGVDFVGDALGLDPRMARVAEALMDERRKHSDDEIFEWGLQVILDGLARARGSVRGPARPPSPSTPHNATRARPRG